MSRLATVEQFEWPEADSLDRHEIECDMHSFVAWLIEIEEINGLSRRALEALHVEYCCHAGVKPLSPRKQSQMWASVGLVKSRPSVYVRQDDGTTKEIRRNVYDVSPLTLFQYDTDQRLVA